MPTFKEVAQQVLSQSAKQLSAKDITDYTLENNLLSTEGQMPSATMAAHLYVDIFFISIIMNVKN